MCTRAKSIKKAVCAPNYEPNNNGGERKCKKLEK